jgi:hypothetical protein
MENGVDAAHFKFVHKTPFVPEFTLHDFSGPVSYVDFTNAFDECVAENDVNSGAESINAELGCLITKSWGMVDNRTMPAVTPVDGFTCDVWFTVWIGRKPGDDSPEITEYGKTMADFVIDQFEADLHIWAHQRYSDPPALSRKESRDSPRCANGRGSSTPPAGPPRPHDPAAARSNPGRHRQSRHRNDQLHPRSSRSGSGSG